MWTRLGSARVPSAHPRSRHAWVRPTPSNPLRRPGGPSRRGARCREARLQATRARAPSRQARRGRPRGGRQRAIPRARRGVQGARSNASIALVSSNPRPASPRASHSLPACPRPETAPARDPRTHRLSSHRSRPSAKRSRWSATPPSARRTTPRISLRCSPQTSPPRAAACTAATRGRGHRPRDSGRQKSNRGRDDSTRANARGAEGADFPGGADLGTIGGISPSPRRRRRSEACRGRSWWRCSG